MYIVCWSFRTQKCAFGVSSRKLRKRKWSNTIRKILTKDSRRGLARMVYPT